MTREGERWRTARESMGVVRRQDRSNETVDMTRLTESRETDEQTREEKTTTITKTSHQQHGDGDTYGERTDDRHDKHVKGPGQ